jgi:hypothetical protein
MSVAQDFVDLFSMTLRPETLEEFRNLERWSLRRSLELCGLHEYPAVRGDPDGVRCSGAMTCPICWRTYYDHPLDWRVLGYNSRAFLNVLCDGRRVKL